MVLEFWPPDEEIPIFGKEWWQDALVKHAAEQGHVQLMEVLRQEHRWAAQNGHLYAVTVLVEGTAKDQATNTGASPLVACSSQGPPWHCAVVENAAAKDQADNIGAAFDSFFCGVLLGEFVDAL